MDVKEELNKKEKDESDVLESILSYVGEMGLYQKLLFVGMLPLGFTFAFVYFVQMFIAATPQSHWCSVPELQHLDLTTRRNLSIPRNGDTWEQCVHYKANWSDVLQTMTPPHPNTSTVPCVHGWDWELGDIPYHTVVSERGWVCEFSQYAPTAQSIFFGGSLVGGLLFGWLADRFGRVPALVGANLIGFVGNVASVFTTDLWDFAFCRFLVGMSYDSCFILMYILILEYVGARYRTVVGNMSIALYFGGGCLVLPWLAVWIADWRVLLFVTSAPMLLVLAAPFVVPESVRWLSSRGHINRAVDVLKRFEKVNGTKIPQDVIDDFVITSRQARNTNESVTALVKSGPLRRMMIYMVIVYMASAVVFDGLVRMSEGLGMDFFVTFTLTSATEIPSITILAFTMDRWGRRALTITPVVLSGVLSLIAAFVSKGAPQVALAITARFFINMSYNAAIQWATELLPTPVRASGSSIVHVSGYVATIVSPFIVYSERYWQPLPLIIMGALALLGGAVGALLPETAGRRMPHSIADGEALVNNYVLCGKAEVDHDEDKELAEKEKALVT